jgi:antitoxin component of RelBE/YafQ-DinJ toxin-antitoxin module
MSRSILQIPIAAELRAEAEKQAEAQGFSSLQEAVRVFLKRFAQGTIGVKFEEAAQLSPKAIKRYNKMIDDIESGREKTYEFTNVDDLMKHLNA